MEDLLARGVPANPTAQTARTHALHGGEEEAATPFEPAGPPPPRRSPAPMPFAEEGRKPRCLVCASRVSTADTTPPDVRKAKTYPYVMALHCRGKRKPGGWRCGSRARRTGGGRGRRTMMTGGRSTSTPGVGQANNSDRREARKLDKGLSTAQWRFPCEP
jgi:hypothetical protein